MTLSGFPLLADENIHADVVAFLRSAGFDVLAVRETTMIGSTDSELLHRANAEGRVIVTHDRDFGQLAVAALQPIVGILFLRPGHIEAAFTIESLGTVLRQGLQLTPPFVLVAERTKGSVRLRLRTW